MFDKLQSRGQEFNVQNLSEALNVKCIPTIAEKEYGLSELLNQIIKIYEEKKKQPRLEIEDSNILTRDNNGKILTIPGGNILTHDNNNISGIKGDDIRICINHHNVPGMIAKFSTVLSEENINIANLVNKSKGDYAYTIIDVDKKADVAAIKSIDGVLRVREL